MDEVVEDERDKFKGGPPVPSFSNSNPPKPIPGADYVFQVRLDDFELDNRLPVTKYYSNLKHVGLMNCTNLVLYVLGITKSVDYIKTCTLRKTNTSYGETLLYISDALGACNKPTEIMFSPDYGIDDLNILTDAILPGYATELSLRKAGTLNGHDVIIRRDACARIFCVDPQQGTEYIYPEVVSGFKQVQEYLQRLGWQRWACILSKKDAIIHFEEHYGCHTTKLPVSVGPAPVAPASTDLQARHLALIARIKGDPVNMATLTSEVENLSNEPGFQIDLQDAAGDTLLIAASAKGYYLIKMLCNLGADFNLENKEKKSALDVVSRKEAKDMLLKACKGKSSGGRKTRRRRRKLTRRKRTKRQ